MKLAASVLALVFLVTGCTQPPVLQWGKVGPWTRVDPEPGNFAEDWNSCDKWARQVVPTYGDPWVDENTRNYSEGRYAGVLEDCMEKKGWRHSE